MSRKRLLSIAGLAALMIALAGLWQWRVHERNGSAALARGMAALDEGDARTARVELMNAIKAAPRSVAARVAQARALVDLGDGVGAQAEIERARTLAGKDAGTRAQTRTVMAEALLLQGDADGALREAGANDVPAGFASAAARALGRAHMARNEMAAARAALDRALRLDPRDPENWVADGRFGLVVGDQAGAIIAADRALALAANQAPNHAKAHAKAMTLRAELTRDQYGLIASLPWFEQAIAADPETVPALENYAATLADAGMASRMLSVTRRILALDPGNARAWMMQAVMAARAGQTDLARGLLARTQGRLDGEPATLLLRGILHLEDGNAVLAADAFAALVQVQPDNRVARTLLGRAYYTIGDYASAATVLAPMVAQRDATPYVLTLAARAQEAMGDRTMAGDMLARAAWPVRAAADPFISVQDQAVAAGPPPADGATAHDNIPYIRALLSTGQPDAAVARAQGLSRANPGASAAWIVLGDALGAADRPAESAQAYEIAANIRFDRAVALRLAAAWSRAGDPARAAQIIRMFLAQNPDDVAAQRLAASIYAQAQDWRGAARMLQAVRSQMGDNDAVLMTDMARAAMETGDGKAALAYAAHAYRLMPGNPMTADIYGWTLMKAGVHGAASIDLLEKAVTLAPGHPVLAMHLGQAYAAAGRKDDARRALGQAVAAKRFAGRQEAVEALAAL